MSYLGREAGQREPLEYACFVFLPDVGEMLYVRLEYEGFRKLLYRAREHSGCLSGPTCLLSSYCVPDTGYALG